MRCSVTVTRFFRNLQPRRVEWEAGLNCLTGPNGAGKTNIIECLHALSGWGCFKTGASPVAWDSGEPSAYLYGEFEGEESVTVGVRVGSRTLVQCGGRRASWTNVREKVPSLAFLAGDLSLVEGTPGVRRAFLDRLCTLLFPPYAWKLSEMRRALRHRGILLKQGRNASLTAKVLAPLVSWIWGSRRSSVAMLASGLERLSDLLPAPLEMCHVRGGGGGADDPLEDFARGLERYGQREREARIPLVGPHRDDMILTNSGRPVLSLSRGQRRRTAVALMIAAGFAVEKTVRRAPMLLLDEIAAELDADGHRRTVDALLGSGFQVFAATAEPVGADWPGGAYAVEAGSVRRVR